MATLQSATIIIPKSSEEEFLEKVEKARPSIMADFEFFHNSVVVAKFIRDKIGNLYTAHQTQTEDKWQGKTGYVIALGPSAFKDEPGFDFHGLSVEPGDWAIYRHTDGWDFDYTIPGTSDKLHLRLLEDTQIKGRTKRPELIW